MPEYSNMKWVILPDDSFKLIWDLLILMYTLLRLMIYTVTITPYRVAFVEEDTTLWFIIDLSVDGLFFCDVFVNCFSAFYTSNDLLIVSNKQIIKKYMKLWFWFDIFACLPFQLILESGAD